MPTRIADSPLTCVAVGAGESLEEFERWRDGAARRRSARRPGARSSRMRRRRSSRDADPRRVPRGVRRAARGPGGRPRRAAGRARCSCGSRPAASATPTSTRPRAPTRRATRRRCSATRARASSSASARASRSSQPGDHVVTLFSPQCGECIHCRSPRTNLCLAIREQQNKGYLPDGTTRLSRDGEPIRHFMGTLDVRRVHRDAGDRAGEGLRRRRRSTARACSPAASRPGSARRC